MIKFFNTLTRKKEPFQTLEKKIVKMYTCGPTVYDFAHIGNFRAYVFEDILHRFLEYAGYKVTRVMNITDIDDKTIIGAKKEGIPLNQYTQRYIDAFFKDMQALGLKTDGVVFPKATEHIAEIVSLIKILMEKGYAYKKGNSIYFKINALPAEGERRYGKLSNLDFSQMQTGTSVDVDEYEKEEAKDFVLWKGEKEDFFWDTEIGRGRPGWHIECSAMSMKYLGETFDIHTGGVDNIFPHHENEIAQSESVTGKTFVRYWLHCEHLLVNSEKMSKSKGNFYTLRDLIDKGYDPVSIRYLLMATHYKDPLNFSEASLKQAENTINNYRDFYQRLMHWTPKQGTGQSASWKESIGELKQKFYDNLANDLNTSGAIGCVFEVIKATNIYADKSGGLFQEEIDTVKEFLQNIDTVLAILNEPQTAQQTEDTSWIEQKIKEREQARKNKDFQKSDAIREELQKQGIIIEDIPSGTRWIKKS